MFSDKGKIFVLLAAILIAGDVLTQELGWHAPWPVSRLGTGFLAGWAVTAFLFASLKREGGVEAHV
jgi:uncharacterized membrane protein